MNNLYLYTHLYSSQESILETFTVIYPVGLCINIKSFFVNKITKKKCVIIFRIAKLYFLIQDKRKSSSILLV